MAAERISLKVHGRAHGVTLRTVTAVLCAVLGCSPGRLGGVGSLPGRKGGKASHLVLADLHATGQPALARTGPHDAQPGSNASWPTPTPRIGPAHTPPRPPPRSEPCVREDNDVAAAGGVATSIE